MNEYTAQTTIRLSVAITASDSGAPVDPAGVSCNLMHPDESSEALTVLMDAAGNYHADFTPSQVGLHRYEWIGTGVFKVAAIGRFLVTQAPF